MTIEEKLENFKASALKDAKMKSKALINDSEESIKKRLDEYEIKAKEDYQNKIKIESSMIISKNNQDITKETLVIKQKIEKRRLELIDEIFVDLEKKLREYKNTLEYKKLLIKQVEEVKKYAVDDKFIVYIDKTDVDLLEDLSKETNTTVEVSKTKIIGGIKAVIEKKNLLIDYSFANRMHEEKENFSF